MKQAVIIFTRVPIPGKTKTRMMPYLTPEECAELHTCFLHDIENECRKCGAELFVSFTPEEEKTRLQGILKEQTYFPQEGADLGEKMHRALQRVLADGYEKCLLIGTDIPEIRAEYLNRAFDILDNTDIVYGRTEDGGYYLVGMKEPHPEVFRISSYGHADVWKETLDALHRIGLTAGFTETLSDMDEPSDLRAYRNRMLTSPSLRESATGQFLSRLEKKISIIIPTYNEKESIQQLQRQLEPIREKCEILFVDGGSTDGTAEAILPPFHVLHSGKGRAVQMNTGAKTASGDILFFLHCDSVLPEDPLGEIRTVMKSHDAGCFGISFDTQSLLMKICARMSNLRAGYGKLMFGDQGIFLDRSLFFQMGMFREIPIMEDYQLSLDLKKRGIHPGMTAHRITTSDRRFSQGTFKRLRVMWQMNRLRARYRRGEDVSALAAEYRDVR